VIPFKEIVALIEAAVECSVYIAPTDTGLTIPEVYEVCTQAGFQEGEINDALPRADIQRFYGKSRAMPGENTRRDWQWFVNREDPEFRNFDAMDFIVNELNALAKAQGVGRAKLDRQVLVSRGAQAGLPAVDLEAGIVVMVTGGRLTETADGLIGIPPAMATRGPPGAELATAPHRATPRPSRARAYPIVEDVIRRRSDGRAPYADPLDAFAEKLGGLGHGRFQSWWVQTVSEMRRADPITAPLSVLVLSAALVEGSLTFIVDPARKRGRGPFQSTDFEKSPRTWKIDDLVASAAKGGAEAVLDNSAQRRAESLLRSRQRIHAGRLIAETTGPVPDLRPEEARDATATAELVARQVLDWLERTSSE
jgi:hypothetical protein